MTLWLLTLLAGAVGGFGFGWLVRDILATRPTSRRYTLHVSQPEPRGELDLDWSDPRESRAILTLPLNITEGEAAAVAERLGGELSPAPHVPLPSVSHIFATKGADAGAGQWPPADRRWSVRV